MTGLSASALTLCVPQNAAHSAASGISLKALAKSRGLRFGTAISAQYLTNRRLTNLIADQCDLLTAENELKWKYFERAPGKTALEDAERIAGFARQHGMRLRGHCFVWNNDQRLPTWLVDQENSLSRDGGRPLIQRMGLHASTLRRYFPQISSWDVVNEAIEPESGELRSSILSRILGGKHIDIAFQLMHQRYPDAELVYNDSMTWGTQAEHRDGVLRLLERALTRGVPIHALGIQSHLAKSLGRPIYEREWRDFLHEVQGMGLSVLLTELDCGDRALSESDHVQRDIEVAAFVKQYLDLTLSFTNVRSVALWSIADGVSYMNRPSFPEKRRRRDQQPLRGHPYDERLRPKPIRDAIATAIAHAPMR